MCRHERIGELGCTVVPLCSRYTLLDIGNPKFLSPPALLVVGICFGRKDFFGGLGLLIPATLGGWKRIVGEISNRKIIAVSTPAILIELLSRMFFDDAGFSLIRFRKRGRLSQIKLTMGYSMFRLG